MHRLILVLAAVSTLALSACGDDDETTVTETTTVETTATEASTEAAKEPRGELSAEGIGPVAVGDRPESVEASFGPPDKETQVPGCELSGDTRPKLAWVWHLPGGNLNLQFDVRDRLSYYRTTSPALQAKSGIRVGDSFPSVRAGYPLRPLDLGTPSTPEAGFWYVGENLDSALLFSITGGKVDSISGGSIEICE